jgi:hypothetical protein
MLDSPPVVVHNIKGLYGEMVLPYYLSCHEASEPGRLKSSAAIGKLKAIGRLEET